MRRFLGLSALLLVAIGFLLYGGALRHEFVELDDPLLITENPAAQSLTWTNLKTAFTTYDPELYIPLTLVSYQIDSVLGGLVPFPFHLHSLLHHILNAWLVTVLAVMLTGKRRVGLLTGLLFLVHPIQVETVLWASGRKDVLSTTFFLLSLLLYMRFLRTERRTPDARWSYAGSLAAFLLGLLSKVTVIALAPILFLVDGREGRRITARSLAAKLPYVALAILFGIVALFGKSNAPPLTPLTRLLVAAKSFTFSVGKLLLPTDLSPMYAYTGPITLQSPDFLLSLAIVLALVIAAVALRQRWNIFSFSAAFLLLGFLPSFGNLVKAGSEYYITADRYAYIPGITFFLLAATAIDHVRTTRLRALVTPATVALLIVLSFVTLRQAAHWSDTLTLARYVTQTTPAARLGHLWHGNALRDAGRPEEALAEYAVALEMREDPRVLYNRALAWEALGKTENALADDRRAVELDPTYALAHINLGRLLYQRGERDEARAHFAEAARFGPMLAMPLFNLGVLAGEERRYDRAVEYYRQAIAREPGFADARANLSVALLALGRPAEAVAELKEALRRDPENPTSRELLRTLIETGVVRTGK